MNDWTAAHGRIHQRRGVLNPSNTHYGPLETIHLTRVLLLPLLLLFAQLVFSKWFPYITTETVTEPPAPHSQPSTKSVPGRFFPPPTCGGWYQLLLSLLLFIKLGNLRNFPDACAADDDTRWKRQGKSEMEEWCLTQQPRKLRVNYF